jgi:hypothetical protein
MRGGYRLRRSRASSRTARFLDSGGRRGVAPTLGSNRCSRTGPSVRDTALGAISGLLGDNGNELIQHQGRKRDEPCASDHLRNAFVLVRQAAEVPRGQRSAPRPKVVKHEGRFSLGLRDGPYLDALPLRGGRLFRHYPPSSIDCPGSILSPCIHRGPRPRTIAFNSLGATERR